MEEEIQNIALQDKPKSVTLAHFECSPQTFPVLREVFIIYLATPVVSVSCKMSFSALHVCHLKLWTRSSIRQKD